MWSLSLIGLYLGLAVWDWALFVAHPEHEFGLMRYMVNMPFLALAFTVITPVILSLALNELAYRLIRRRANYAVVVALLAAMRATVIAHNYAILGQS